MSKQLIIYNVEKNECKNATIDESTFTLAEQPDGSYVSMTYGEWEALRCTQACAAAKARVAEDLPEAKQEAALAMLDSFTEAMHVKYLEGKRSWGQIYDELVDDFKALCS